jgi:hypothetical protein
MESPHFIPLARRPISIGVEFAVGVRRTPKENTMGAVTTLMTRHLAIVFRRTRTRLELLGRSDARYALQTAVTTLVVAITGRLEYLVNELWVPWIRSRLLSRDEAGYMTKTLIIAGLVVVVAFAAFVFLWMTVISKAIHTRVSCHPGSPCG